MVVVDALCFATEEGKEEIPKISLAARRQWSREIRRGYLKYSFTLKNPTVTNR